MVFLFKKTNGMTKMELKKGQNFSCLFEPGIQYFVCVLSENIEIHPPSTTPHFY